MGKGRKEDEEEEEEEGGWLTVWGDVDGMVDVMLLKDLS